MTSQAHVSRDHYEEVRSGGQRRMKARVRRLIFAGVLLALLGGNTWIVRRQFPPIERQKHEAYDRGLDAFTSQDYELAAAQFSKYLELSPNTERVRYWLGLALQQLGREADAAAEFRRVLELNDMNDEVRMLLAEMDLAAQRFHEALAWVAAAQEHEPTPAGVFITLARVRNEVGDPRGAAAAYREAVKRDPTAYESYLWLADLTMSAAIISGSYEDRIAAGNLYAEAEGVCRLRLASLESRDVRLGLARSIAGQARVLQKRSLQEAVDELRTVAEQYPDDPEPTLILARFFSRTGNHPEALRQLGAAIKKWQTAAVYVALHDQHVEMGNENAALKSLEDAVAAHPDDSSLRIRLVGYLVRRGDLDRARQEADAAEALFGSDSQIQEARGDLAVEGRAVLDGASDESGKLLDDAINYFAAALNGKPNSPRLKKKVARELIARVARARDLTAEADTAADERRARTLVEEVLALNPRDTEALASSARLLASDGSYDVVVAQLRGALDAQDPETDSLRLLSYAGEQIGDFALAADAALRLVDILTRRGRADESQHDLTAASHEDWLNAVRLSLRAGKLDLSVRLALEGAGAYPAEPRFRWFRGRAQLLQGEFKPAIHDLEKAKRSFSADTAIRLLLADAYEKDRRVEEAEAEYRALLDTVGTDEIRTAWFGFLARTGRTDLAEDGLLALVRSRPTDPSVRLRVGDFYLSRDPPRVADARREYLEALRLSEGDPAPVLRIAELELGVARDDAAHYSAAEAAVQRFADAAADSPWVPYLRGKLALVGGRPDEAVPLLKTFVDALPASASGLFHYGRALRLSGEPGAAEAPLVKAAQLDPESMVIRLELSAVRYRMGVIAFQAGDFERATALFESANRGAGRESGGFLVAGAQANSGQLERSAKACRELLEREPQNMAAIHLLAAVMLRLGRPEHLDEAAVMYRRAMKIRPDDLFAQVGMGTVQFRRGQYAEALASFKTVYPRTQGNAGLAFGIAQCMSILGRAVEAVDFLEGESTAHPESSGLLHIKGDFLVHVRQYEDAVKSFLAAYALDPENHVAFLAAVAALMADQRSERAETLLREEIPRSKKPSLLHLALGDLMTRQRRLDEATAELQRGLALEPGHPQALSLLGALAEERGEREEARRLYREAVNAGAIEAEPRIRLAQMATRDGDRAAAIEMYSSALRYHPRHVLVLNNLAILVADDETQLEYALQLSGLAHGIEPDRPDIADTFGWLLFRANKVKDAARVLEAAARQLQLDPVVHYHAGAALARVGRETDAIVHLERALNSETKFEEREAAQSLLERLR